MTQFLLLQASDPRFTFDGIVIVPAERFTGAVADAASSLFPDRSVPVWKVCPRGDEMDLFADEARDAILEGRDIRLTRIGTLLREAVARGYRFSLFYASYTDDLPAPTTESALFDLLTEQLNSDGTWSWELYAAWRPCA